MAANSKANDNRVAAGSKGHLVEKSKDFFHKLNKDTLGLVDQFYDPNIHFQDPIHELKSAKEIKDYYGKLYKNVRAIRFVFTSEMESGSSVALFWQMYLTTDALNGGKEYRVDGMSKIDFGANGLATYHRDYFDMGDFVYERIPVVSNLIRFIRGKMAGK